jgi:hypothetical protein
MMYRVRHVDERKVLRKLLVRASSVEDCMGQVVAVLGDAWAMAVLVLPELLPEPQPQPKPVRPALRLVAGTGRCVRAQGVQHA